MKNKQEHNMCKTVVHKENGINRIIISQSFCDLLKDFRVSHVVVFQKNVLQLIDFLV